MSEFAFLNTNQSNQSGSNWESKPQYTAAPVTESYQEQVNPSEFDSFTTRQPKQNYQTRPINNAFVDVNDPRNFQQTNSGASAYQKNLNELSARPQPNYSSANGMVESITNSMDMFENIAGTTTGTKVATVQDVEQSDPNDPLHGYRIAMKALYNAVYALENIEYALPAKLPPKYAVSVLVKTATTVVEKGLKPIIDTLEKLV